MTVLVEIRENLSFSLYLSHTHWQAEDLFLL